MGIYSIHNPSNGCTDYQNVLVKLTLILPDKGEIELRDDLTAGEPSGGYPDSSGCRAMSAYRGRRWHATDGSGTVFISDVDNAVISGDLNGTLITGDGTRYRFSTATQPIQSYGSSAYLQWYAHATSVTDRNGNIVNINYPSSSSVQFVDPLGRITKIDYNTQDPVTGQPVAVLVTLPGSQGQNRYYKILTDTMNLHYRSDITPTLPVINGDSDTEGYGYAYTVPHTTLFPGSYGRGAERIDTEGVVTQLVLPDGRSLSFNYNEFGEVAEVVLPTGGKIQYDYAYTPRLPSGNSLFFEVHPTPPRIPSDVHDIDRAVSARRTYSDGSTLESSWSYTYGPQTAPDGISYGCTEVQARAADNTLMLDQRHFFMAAGRFLSLVSSQIVGTGYSLWSTGIEKRSETRDAANTVIAANEQDWSQRAPVAWTYYSSQQIANDNRVNEERKILNDGSAAKIDTFYQANVRYNNASEIDEYDYDQTLKRRTVTTFADSSNLINGQDYTSDSIHLLSLALMRTVYDSSANQIAQAITEYDNYSQDGNHAGLQDYGSVIQHDSNYGAANGSRGNPTALGRWLNTNNTTIYSYPRYDTIGNVISTKDARGNVTTIDYTDDFGDGSNPDAGASGANGATYALPTLITSPPPQSGQAQQTARSQYDFSTGLLTGFKDRNGNITQTFYNDPFDRPTLIKSALNSGAEAHTAMYYAPTTAFGISLTNNDVLTAKDQTNIDDAVLRSWTRTDGFGRKVQTWSRDPQGDDEVITVYDALGRVKQVSNPLRPSLSETAVYSTTGYDLAGRVNSVTTPDNAVVATSYSGNTVTVTDQAGKQRKSVTDGLGRLIQVYEDPAGLNYLTSYSYDALDDLTTVTQSPQPSRNFLYDSLKRLTSATNRESGTVSYQYDNNGNLTQKSDARLLADNQTHVTTSYVYDALNRLTSRSYNDGTPNVTYAYDTATNGRGRLVSVSSSVSTYSYSGYDAMGRALGGTQTIGSQSYSISRVFYDLAGHIKSMTYPSGRSVTNAFDNAGRLNDFRGNLGDGSPRVYATGISYDSASRWTREQFGTAPTPLYNKRHYNIRGQLYDARLSTVNDDFDWNRGNIANYYNFQNYGFGTSGTDNNGNILIQQHWIPDGSGGYTVHQQNYSYDSLNRISWVGEYLNGSQNTGSQTYSYDRFGNRSLSGSGTGTSNLQFSIDPNTNRYGVPGGQSGTMSYDPAGNLTFDSYSGQGQMVYDAENRMQQAWANSQWQTYTYDGDGHRVKRNVNGTETWQVYGLGGELLAEYAANASPSSPQKEYGYRNGELLVTVTSTAGDAHWLVTDQLGTPRMIADQTGSLSGVSRHDYLPFGEELFAGTGGRTQAQGYSASDGVRQHFTQKERDNETGLDYFLARYYSSTQGRFISPDPLSAPASAHPRIPQSWNLYAYVLNNPLKLVDPDGMMWIYEYLNKQHTKIGIAWIDGNKIPKGYHALNFGGQSSRDVTLTDGSVVRFSATSKNPLQLRGPDPSSGNQAYVNTEAIREFNRQTAPIPAATAAFILISLNGGYAIAGSSIALLDAAAFALNAAREQSQNDAAVMARTSSLYDDSGTSKSLEYKNIREVNTDVTKSEFIDNLVQSGYKMSQQGDATILEKGGNRYTVYDAKSGRPSAGLNIGGEGQSLKIRLKP